MKKLIFALLFSLASFTISAEIQDTSQFPDIKYPTNYESYSDVPAPEKEVDRSSMVGPELKEIYKQMEAEMPNDARLVPKSKNGWRKLVGHELEPYYAIYFYVGKGLTPGITVNTEIIPLVQLDLKEIIKGSLPSGSITFESRKSWYQRFNQDLKWNRKEGFDRSVPDLYKEWYYLNSGIEAQTILRTYVRKFYLPKYFPDEKNIKDF